MSIRPLLSEVSFLHLFLPVVHTPDFSGLYIPAPHFQKEVLPLSEPAHLHILTEALPVPDSHHWPHHIMHRQYHQKLSQPAYGPNADSFNFFGLNSYPPRFFQLTNESIASVLHSFPDYSVFHINLQIYQTVFFLLLPAHPQMISFHASFDCHNPIS